MRGVYASRRFSVASQQLLLFPCKAACKSDSLWPCIIAQFAHWIIIRVLIMVRLQHVRLWKKIKILSGDQGSRGSIQIFFFSLRRDTFFPMNSWKFLADLLHIRQCAKFLLALTWHIQTLEHNFQLSTAVKEGRMLVVVLSIVCCWCQVLKRGFPSS